MRARPPEPVVEGGPYDHPTYRQWNRRRRMAGRMRGKRADRVALVKQRLAPLVAPYLLRAVFRPALFPRLLYRVTPAA